MNNLHTPDDELVEGAIDRLGEFDRQAQLGDEHAKQRAVDYLIEIWRGNPSFERLCREAVLDLLRTKN